MISLAALLAEPSGWAPVTLVPVESQACSTLHDTVYDVVIGGAGITGLTAAIHAARRGMQVAVLEAGQPGTSASGRNSDFVIPALSRAGRPELEHAWGAARAAAFCGSLSETPNELFGFVRKEGLSCSACQNGWLQPDQLDASDPLWLTWLQALHAGEVKARIIKRDELNMLTGSTHYPAALYLPEDGQIDPLAFTRGLAATCKRLGCMLMEGCVLLDLPREQLHRHVRLETSHGPVFTCRAILATNATSCHGAGKLATAAMLFALLLASYDLPRTGAEEVLQQNVPLSDSSRDMWFFRRLDSTRLITGLLPTTSRLSRELIDITLRQRIERVFGIALARLSALWAGPIGITPRGLPRLLQLAPNVLGWTGCNGRGIARSFPMRRWLAALAADAPAESVSVPVPLQSLRRVHAPRIGVWITRKLVAAERQRRVKESRRGASVAGGHAVASTTNTP